MKLLLTHAYFLHADEKELQIMKPYAPLGILYLSSYLRSKGFGVEIYDSTFGSRDELFRILREGPPAAVGIYGHFGRTSDPVAALNHALARVTLLLAVTHI